MKKVRSALLKLKEICSEYSRVSLRVDTEDDYIETSLCAAGMDNTEDDVDETADDSDHNKGENCPASETSSDEQRGRVVQNYGIAFDSYLQLMLTKKYRHLEKIFTQFHQQKEISLSAFSGLLNWSPWYFQCNAAQTRTPLIYQTDRR